MRKTRVKLAVTPLLAAMLSVAVPSHASSPGSASANFLKIGVGARGAAMGDAQAAASEDATAIHWNPARLASLRYRELSLMHYSLIEGVRYQHVGFAVPTESRGTWAVALNMLDYGKIEGFDQNSIPTGQLDASNMLLSVGWGRQISATNKLAVGATFKYLQSELAGFKASAPMLDLGISQPFSEGGLRGLRVAAGIRNLGSGLKYDAETSDLPRQLYLGAAFTALGDNLTVALDMIRPDDNAMYLASGLDYRVFDLMHLRLGYNGKSEFVGNGLTYGVGMRFNQWNLDYAFVPLGELGNTSRVSLGVRFGRAMEMKQADDQVDAAYRRARGLYARGKGIEAYNTLKDLISIAPWHKPSIELKAKIEKQFSDMAASKNAAQLDAQIADLFTRSKAAFDRDDLVEAKRGFDTVLELQPTHVGSKVYLDRIQNRYASLANEAFKEGMTYYAAGDYVKAQEMFEKTLTIQPDHADAKAQLEKSKQLIADQAKRAEEMARLQSAGEGYRIGLEAFQKNDFETALVKFEEVKAAVPDYEEVSRYYELTKKTLGGVLFEQSQVLSENNSLEEAVVKLKRAAILVPEDTRIKTALEIAQRDLGVRNTEESKKLYKQGLEAYLNGQTDKAAGLWKRSLELDSGNDDALKALTKLEEQRKYERRDQ